VGVWNLGGGLGSVGLGTLLGFEESHVLEPPCCGGWASFPWSSAGLAGGEGLVGVVVDSWIVDASILLAPHRSLLLYAHASS